MISLFSTNVQKHLRYALFLLLLLPAGLLHAQEWEPLGPDDFNQPFPASSASVAMAVDKKGVIYVADFETEPFARSSLLTSLGRTSFKLTVRKFEQGRWRVVGDRGFAHGWVYQNSLAPPMVSIVLDHNDVPYVVVVNSDTMIKTHPHDPWTNSLYGPAYVMKFDGSRWAELGAPLFRKVNYAALTFDTANTPYLMVHSGNTGVGASPFLDFARYVGNNWEQFPAVQPLRITPPYYSLPGWGGRRDGFFMFFIDNNNHLYAGFSRSGFGNNRQLIKMDLATGQVKDIGSDVIAANPGFSLQTSLATQRNMYFFRGISPRSFSVHRLRQGSDTLEKIGQDVALSAAFSNVYDLFADGQETIYVALADSADHDVIRFMKYDGMDWVETFSPYRTKQGGRLLENFVVDNRGSICFLTGDDLWSASGGRLNADYKNRVYRFQNNTWQVLGDTSIAVPRQRMSQYLMDQSGTSYAVFSEGYWWSSKMIFKKFNNGKWEELSSYMVPDVYVGTQTGYHTSAPVLWDKPNVSIYDDNDLRMLYRTSKHKIVYARYNGAGWDPIAEASLRDTISSTQLYLDGKKTPYLAEWYYEIGAGNTRTGYLAIKKYNGSVWEVIYKEKQDGSTHSFLTFDKAEAPYIVYWQPNANYLDNGPVIIKKYIGGDSWTTVADAKLEFTDRDNLGGLVIDFDGKGNLYVMYSMYSHFTSPSVRRQIWFSKYQDGKWVSVGQGPVYEKDNNECLVRYNTSDLIFFFDPAGTPYLAFNRLEEDRLSAVVMKYENENWNQVSRGDVANTFIDLHRLATQLMYRNGRLYFAYESGAGGNEGLNWQSAGAYVKSIQAFPAAISADMHLSLGGIVAYPNPFTTNITVRGLPDHAVVTITDIMGKQVYSRHTSGQTTYEVQPAAGLVPGVYLLMVKDLQRGTTSATTLVKQDD